MRTWVTKVLWVWVVLLGSTGVCGAQSLSEALRLYQDKHYDDAASALYDVVLHEANDENRDQAQIYLAESLRKMKMYVPALFYYADILKAGKANRYYVNAIEGLLDVRRDAHDVLFVPSLLSAYFDSEGFARLDAAKIAEVNYLMGEVALRQRKYADAKAFLDYVPRESAFYARSQYLRGVLDVRAGQWEGAVSHFRAVVSSIDESVKEESLAHVRRMAQLALGRAYYSMGQYPESVATYRSVPRLTDDWFTALYEGSWAYFQNKEYGRALGEVESVLSPYFAKRHAPEAYVVAGTTYFANCQWDRVRGVVKSYQDRYAKMVPALAGYVASAGKEPSSYYTDVVKGGVEGVLDVEVARTVRGLARFKEYHFMLEHMAWEKDQVQRVDVWKGSRFASDMGMIIEQHHTQLLGAVGTWVHTQLRNTQAQLAHVNNQMNILDFEVSDAERNWLEEGKEIARGPRVRVPRPEIPNDQWQHWNFEKEFWKDEIGNYQHALRAECR
jgi:tetratricopeptide (TPR) repeat protein